MAKPALIIGICALIAAPTLHATPADDWTPRPVKLGKPLDYDVQEGGVFRGGVVLNQSDSIVIRFDNGRYDRYSMPLYRVFESLDGDPRISANGRWVACSTYQEREIGDYPAELPNILRLDRRTRRVARLSPGKVPPDDWFFNWALSRDGKRIMLASARFLRVYDTVSLKLIEKRAWPLAIQMIDARRYKTATYCGIFDLTRGYFRLLHFRGPRPELVTCDLRTRRVTRRPLLVNNRPFAAKNYDNNSFYRVFYAADARTVWITHYDRACRSESWKVFDAQNGRFLWSRTTKDFVGLCDGGKLALWANWRHLLVYDVRNGVKIRTLPIGGSVSQSYFSSSDGRWLFTDYISGYMMRQRLR